MSSYCGCTSSFICDCCQEQVFDQKPYTSPIRSIELCRHCAKNHFPGPPCFQDHSNPGSDSDSDPESDPKSNPEK